MATDVMKKAQIRLNIQQKMIAEDEKALEVAESHNAVNTVTYLKARLERTRKALKATQDIIDEQLKMQIAAKAADPQMDGFPAGPPMPERPGSIQTAKEPTARKR